MRWSCNAPCAWTASSSSSLASTARTTGRCSTPSAGSARSAPAEAVERLNREANAVLEMPEVRRRLLEVGVEARGGTPEALRGLLASEVGKWREVIGKARIERQ